MKPISVSRKYGRRPAFRNYIPNVLMSTEGSITEPQYFLNVIRPQAPNVIIQVLPSKKDSSPKSVLNRIVSEIKEHGLRKGDSAWVVIDRDVWTEDQLNEVVSWTETAPKGIKYGLVLSNPKFEYWLLLHFEAGNKLKSVTDLDNRLKSYLPDYDKNIPANKFTVDLVRAAIQRAKKKHDFSEKWPRQAGGTTVFILVEEIFDLNERMAKYKQQISR